MKISFSALGVGVAFCLLVFTSASQASVTIVDNMPSPLGSATTASSYNSGTSPVGTVFTMSSASGQKISSLTLELHNQSGSQSGTVYLFGTSSGLPSSGTGVQIGTFSDTVAGNSAVSVTLSGTQPVLTASTTYAIVLEGYTSSIEWDYTSSSASGGTGTSGRLAYNDSGTHWRSDSVLYGQMDLLTAVPEVPMTGTLMGFGVLAIVGVHTLRRKLSAPKAA